MKLTAEQRWVGASALTLLLLARVGLRLLGLRRAERLLYRSAWLYAAPWRLRFGRRPAPDHAAVVRAVNGASRYLPGTTSCLTRALAAAALLRGYGRDQGVCLRVGVAKTPAGELCAHAWLERHGVLLIGDPQGVDYRPFDGLGGVR